MSKKDINDLLKFLKPFNKDTVELVLWLRELVWDRYPKANELIYDNYNALAFGWSITQKLSHTFCSIAIGRTSNNVHFGFYWGSQLSDPENRLLGQGSQYRYVLVKSKKDFPKKYILELLKEAHANSLTKVKKTDDIPEGTTVVKSISPTKRTKKGNIAKKTTK